LALRPDDAAAHANLAVVLMDQDLLDDAMIHCRRAVELRPDLAVTHHNLAVALKGLGALDEAEACCRRALAIAPDYAAALNTLGIVLKERERLHQVGHGFCLAVEPQPGASAG